METDDSDPAFTQMCHLYWKLHDLCSGDLHFSDTYTDEYRTAILFLAKQTSEHWVEIDVTGGDTICANAYWLETMEGEQDGWWKKIVRRSKGGFGLVIFDVPEFLTITLCEKNGLGNSVLRKRFVICKPK